MQIANLLAFTLMLSKAYRVIDLVVGPNAKIELFDPGWVKLIIFYLLA